MKIDAFKRIENGILLISLSLAHASQLFFNGIPHSSISYYFVSFILEVCIWGCVIVGFYNLRKETQAAKDN
jgi:hypothetical protein